MKVYITNKYYIYIFVSIFFIYIIYIYKILDPDPVLVTPIRQQATGPHHNNTSEF